MTKKKAWVIASALATAVSATLVPAVARATVDATATNDGSAIERVHPLTVADVVVNGTPPAPAEAPVVAPAAPAPVVETPAHTSQATIVEHEQHNYMETIAVSALMGGIAGALVGGSLYFLADNQTHGARIGYWAAGGVLVGSVVGLTQIIVQEGRVDSAPPASRCCQRTRRRPSGSRVVT